MKTILIILASFALAGIIISPFFWLRFLKVKSVAGYLAGSSVATLFIFGLYIYFGYDFIGNLTAKINADLYYFFYDVIDFVIYIVILLVILAPFIFTKTIKHKFTIKNFIFSLVLSSLIFVSIFLYWSLVLLPEAFSHLHDYF